jgi:hypothetical protein
VRLAEVLACVYFFICDTGPGLPFAASFCVAKRKLALSSRPESSGEACNATAPQDQQIAICENSGRLSSQTGKWDSEY